MLHLERGSRERLTSANLKHCQSFHLETSWLVGYTDILQSSGHVWRITKQIGHMGLYIHQERRGPTCQGGASRGPHVIAAL